MVKQILINFLIVFNGLVAKLDPKNLTNLSLYYDFVIN